MTKGLNYEFSVRKMNGDCRPKIIHSPSDTFIYLDVWTITAVKIQPPDPVLQMQYCKRRVDVLERYMK